MDNTLNSGDGTELRAVFDTWLRTARSRYADRQWLLSKWEVCDGIEWSADKIAAMIMTIEDGLRLRQDHILADLGCGGGWITQRLRGRVGRVIGVDFCAEMLAIAAAQGPGPWVQGDISRIPLQAGTVDRVLSYFVFLNFISDDFVDAALASIVRVLAPGGIALIGQLPAVEGSKEYDCAKHAYLEYCRTGMLPGARNDDGTRAPLRLFDRVRLVRSLEKNGCRYEIRPSFNPFYRVGQPLTVDWRFDLVIFRD